MKPILKRESLSAMRKSTLLIVFVAVQIFLVSDIKAETLQFSCVWDGHYKVGISVDTDTMIATRDDAGSNYKVMKITDKAVFLQLEIPDRYLVALQVIERPSGGWHDIIVYGDGRQSALEGGNCEEIK